MLPACHACLQIDAPQFATSFRAQIHESSDGKMHELDPWLDKYLCHGAP
jgi:hypothetical protein